MEPPYEDLSRLLQGDLPEQAARDLRAKIASDPELGAAWTGLSAAVDDLASLRDVAAPPALDARVINGRAPRMDRRLVCAPFVVGGLLAAAAALVVLARPSDGQVTVTVAPTAVTVAVVRGTATVTGPSGTPVVLSPGETRTIDASTLGAPSASLDPGTPAEASARITALEAELVELRRRVERAEFSGAVARGQLTAQQGPLSDWPKDVPEAYRQAAFEKNLEASLAELPGAEVHALDCSEFPCIVTLRISDTTLGWEQRVEAFVTSLADTRYPKSDTWLAIAKSDTDGNIVGGVGLAFSPEYALTEDVRMRTQYRVGSLLQEIGDEDP